MPPAGKAKYSEEFTTKTLVRRRACRLSLSITRVQELHPGPSTSWEDKPVRILLLPLPLNSVLRQSRYRSPEGFCGRDAHHLQIDQWKGNQSPPALSHFLRGIARLLP